MQFTPVLALYDPFGVDVPLNLDITHSFISDAIINTQRLKWIAYRIRGFHSMVTHVEPRPSIEPTLLFVGKLRIYMDHFLAVDSEAPGTLFQLTETHACTCGFISQTWVSSGKG